MFLRVVQRMMLETILDVLYFPVWWFTSGARQALLFCVGLVREGNGILAPGLWLQNIFVPMFGQWDWQGRIMSFFMRVVNIIGRTLGLLIWTVISMLLFFVWILFPTLVLYMLLISFVSL